MSASRRAVTESLADPAAYFKKKYCSWDDEGGAATADAGGASGASPHGSGCGGGRGGAPVDDERLADPADYFKNKYCTWTAKA